MDMIKQFIELQNSIESLKWIIGGISFTGVALSVYITSRIKKLAEIETNLANLPKLEKIETTINKAIKSIDYKYWHKQQIEQLKRDKIEKLMIEVQNHSRYCSQAYVEVVQGRTPMLLLANNTIIMLVLLYFKELDCELKKYNDAFAEFQVSYTDLLFSKAMPGEAIRYTKSQSEELLMIIKGKLDDFMMINSIFAYKISEYSKGLTSDRYQD